MLDDEGTDGGRTVSPTLVSTGALLLRIALVGVTVSTIVGFVVVLLELDNEEDGATGGRLGVVLSLLLLLRLPVLSVVLPDVLEEDGDNEALLVTVSLFCKRRRRF